MRPTSTEMRKGLALLALALSLVAASEAGAALRVVACEPEWGALVTELGGDAVSVYVATTALQDPHRIEARPSLIAKVRRARLVVCTGAELEVGWLPVLVRQAGNRHVQPGHPGYFLAADHVPLLDVPSSVDRSEGDVHASGNPHIQNDPRNIQRVATALAKRLTEVDPEHADHYRSRHTDFEARWTTAMTSWAERAVPLRGMQVVVHHVNWVYLEHWLGLERIGALESKPGVPPMSGHLARLLKQAADSDARAVLRTPYQDARASDWLTERTQLTAVMLPYTVGGTDGAGDLFGLFDETLRLLLKVAP